MLTRKFGILAMVVGAAFLGSACEKKDGDIIIPPVTPVITLQIAPDPVPALKVTSPQQTFQLLAIVSGSATQTATWTSSVPAVATVNATTGLVTAVAAGTTVITAVSSADATARDAVTVTVNPAPPTPPPAGPPSISISTINQTVCDVFGSCTTVPTNPGNVFGVIDITANVRVPAGSTANRLQIDLVSAADTAVIIAANVCQQLMTSPTTGADANVVITCSVNTAGLDPNGAAMIANGSYRVVARVCTTGNSACTAGAGTLNSAFSQTLVFNNMDVLNAVLRLSGDGMPNAPAGVMTRANDINGLAWYGNGDVVVDIRPAIYSTTQASPLGGISALQVSMTSTPGASWFCGGDPDGDGVAALVDPDGDACALTTAMATAAAPAGTTNLLRATFPKATAFAAGVAGSGGIEDFSAGIGLGAVTTVSGNPFSGGFLLVFPSSGTVVPVPVGGPNPLRLDNLAPRVTAFDVTPAALGCAPLAACYVNDGFVFAAGTPTAAARGVQGSGAYSVATGFRSVDFGSDRQTAAFDIVDAGTGATLKAGTQGAATSTTGVAESATSGAYVVRATTIDALGNSNARFASTTSVAGGVGAVVGVSAFNSAGVQTIGVDRLSPVLTSTAVGPAGSRVTPLGVTLNSTNGTDASEAATTVTISFRDTAAAPAGPSGFTGAPFAGNVALTIYNAASGTGGAAQAAPVPVCGAISPTSSSCVFTIADAGTNGYYRFRARVRDASFPGGNVSDSTFVVYLDDETVPTVAGVTAPSTITPNTPTTFGADMNDNVELGDNLVSLGYPNVTSGATAFYAHQPRRVMATFGPEELTTSATSTGVGSFTFDPMVVSLQSSGAVGCNIAAPFLSCPQNGAGDNGFVTAVNFAVRDMAGARVGTVCPAPALPPVVVDGTFTQGGSALFTEQGIAAAVPNGSCIQRQNNTITPNVVAGFGTAIPFNFGTIANFFDFIQNDPCRGTAAIFGRASTTAAGPAGTAGGFDCAAAPAGTVVTLQAEAHGGQGVLANPFTQGVKFYRLDASGRWVIVDAAAATVQVFDDDVLAVRRWIYTVVTNTTEVPVGSTVRAVGLRSNAGLIATNFDNMTGPPPDDD